MMKGRLILAPIVVVAAGVAVLGIRARWIDSSATPTGDESRDPRGEEASVGVDSFMRNVDRYRRQPLRVEGVVSAASQEEGSLALIDRAEFERCGLGCAELTLPIRWSGPMPAIQDTVRVQGEVQKDGGKLVFVAGSVEVVGAGSDER